MRTTHPYLLAIDIGKEKSVALSGKRNGSIIRSAWSFSRNREDYEDLVKGLSPRQTIVGFEATGHYWLALYEFLTKRGFDIVVFNPLQVHSFRDAGIRGSKTDKIDAQLIFDILLYSDRIELFSEKPKKTMELRNLTRLRTNLVKQKTRLINQLTGILDVIFPEYSQVISPKTKTSLELLKRYPSAEEIAALPLPKLSSLIAKASRRKEKAQKWAVQLQEKAGESIGAKLGVDTFSLELKIVIQRINQAAKQIKSLDKSIKKISESFPQQELLVSIPGVGTIIAAVILAEIGDIKKFAAKDGGEKLVAFAGLDARARESGKFAGQVKMTKRGSSPLRSAFWQAAGTARTKDEALKAVYQKHKKRNKHHYVCLSYVAKKLARITYSVLMNNKPYHSISNTG